MPQALQPATTPTLKATKPGKGQDCDWSNCRKDHPKKLKYPDNGDVARSDAFRGTMLGQSLQPWENGNYGVGTKPIILRTGKIKQNSDGTTFTDYMTQAHHLVPCEEIKNTSTLKSNAVLAGWDINSVVNGIMLPKLRADIAIHELPHHSGSHIGAYTGPIGDELRELEKDFANMCHGKVDISMQLMLVDELQVISRKALNMVLNIRALGKQAYWPLHSDSLNSFNASVNTYKKRKKLNASLPR